MLAGPLLLPLTHHFYVCDTQVQVFFVIKVAAGSLDLVDQISDILESAAYPVSYSSTEKPPSHPTTLHKEGVKHAAAVHTQTHERAFSPRPAFRSVWSSNVRSILAARGIASVDEDLVELETGRWYRISSKGSENKQLTEEVDNVLHDRMTECPLHLPRGFEWGKQQRHQQQHIADMMTTEKDKADERGIVLPLNERGQDVLKEMSDQYGLGLGEWEMEFLSRLFLSELERNPTDVEIFDVSQSLSEHCRHWTFDSR